MNQSDSSSSKRNKLTAIRLIKNLESSSSNIVTSTDYHAILKQLSTIKHVKSIIQNLDEPASTWASTSQNPQRGSIKHLLNRLSKIEMVVLHQYTAIRRQRSISSKNSIEPISFDSLIPAFPNFDLTPTDAPLETQPHTSSDSVSIPMFDASTTTPERPSNRSLSSSSTHSPSLTSTPSNTLSPEPSVLRSRNTAFPSISTFDPDKESRSPPSSSASKPIPPPPQATTTDSVLQHHHDLQSSLTSSLSTMATQLKLNSLLFAESLQKDKLVMEDAQDKLGGNLETMKKEGGRLEGYKRKSGGTTCFVLMALGGVAVMWVFIFLLIKVS